MKGLYQCARPIWQIFTAVYRFYFNNPFTTYPFKPVKLMSEDEKINFIIDQFYDSGKCEVTTQISKQLPIRVIAEQLGVPMDDYDKFSNWSDAFVAQLSGTSSPEEHIEIAKKLVQFQQYFANKLDESEDNASDDILSDLANLTFEDDDGVNRKLEKSEQLSIIQQLLVAGNATPAHRS